MNELIPLHSQTINANAIETVNARELHAFLDVKTKYYDWITKRIQDYGFRENDDYVCLTEKKLPKHLMVERVLLTFLLTTPP